MCTPRVLGALTFVAMLAGIYRSWLNLPTIGDHGYIASVEWRLFTLGALVLATGVLFYLYTIYREDIATWPIFARAERVASILMSLPRAIVADVLLPPTRMRAGGAVASNLGPFLLLLMFVCFTILPILFPLTFAELFPRAGAVAFIIGGWIPLLAYLSAVGREARAPFISIAIALAILLPLFLRYDYSVRLIQAEKHVAELVPGTSADSVKPLMEGIGLGDAVAWWKAANCDPAGKCPRPIIIAAAGGASRAGFFTASVIGQLLDDTLVVDGAGHGLTAAEIAKRMFALSTVSGSSVGAVMTVAALAASRDGAQPCRIPAHGLWFGPHDNEKIGWRACLEALMSGDFLTPVAAGFVFRDVLRFFALVLPWYDRAALLERSWEYYFADLIGKPRAADGLVCAGSLDCPFMTLRPSDKRWLPLLVLNGTSVGTGQRIVTTALQWDYDVAEKISCPFSPRVHPCQIFTDGFIFHNLLQGTAPERSANDLRLSTAAHNSARFPFVSPPGTIVNSDRQVVDRIVDGGYFENFGAQSAQELAQAIRAIDSSLNPFVLVLSNDPQAPRPKLNANATKAQGQETSNSQRGLQKENSSTGTQAKAKPAKPAAGQEAELFPDITAPITAFANTRNARGTLAVDSLGSTLDGREISTCNVTQITVWGEPERDWFGRPRTDTDKQREVSMSWWLSKPVQIYLHDQTQFVPSGRGEGNRLPAQLILDALLDKPARENMCGQDTQ